MRLLFLTGGMIFLLQPNAIFGQGTPSKTNAVPAKTVASTPQVDDKTPKMFTKIDADHLDYNSEKRIGIFEGNVVANDPQLLLKCKKMIVYFGEKNNQVIRVEAFENVHMLHEGKEGIGDKAVFNRETGLIVLSGNRPVLKDPSGNSMVSRGEGIIYDVRTKLMHADKPEIVIQSSEAGGLMNSNNPK